MNLFVNLISTLGGLYLLAVLLRFLLQIARADFYNPLSQAVVQITNPLVKLFRSFVPGYRGVDFSSLLLALVIEAVLIVAITLVMGDQMASIGEIFMWSIAGVLLFILQIYFWAIIAAIIMSFVMMFSGSMSPHPALQLIWQLTEPIMAPVRKVIPPIGGLDFSPILIFIAIRFLQDLLIQVFQITGPIAVKIVGI
jgi:YggT family protein